MGFLNPTVRLGPGKYVSAIAKASASSGLRSSCGQNGRSGSQFSLIFLRRGINPTRTRDDLPLRRTASGAAIVRPTESDDYGVFPKDAPPKKMRPPGTKIGFNSDRGRLRAKDSWPKDYALPVSKDSGITREMG